MSLPDLPKGRLALTAAAAIMAVAVVGTAAAQSMVVRSTGPSASKYPTGAKLKSSDRLTLVAGDKVVLMQAGKTRTLSGPGTFGASGTIQASQPFAQCRQYLSFVPLFQHAFGLLPGITFGSSQHVKQLVDTRIDQLRTWHQRTAFRGEPPDASMHVVATFVAKVDFTMLNDGVVPVGNVDRPIRSLLNINGTKRHVIGADDIGLLPRDKSGTLVFHHEATDAMTAKVVRN